MTLSRRAVAAGFYLLLFSWSLFSRSAGAQTIVYQSSFESGFGANANTGNNYPGNNWTVNGSSFYAYQGSKCMESDNPYSSGGNPYGDLNIVGLSFDSGYVYQVRFYQNCFNNTANCKLRIKVSNFVAPAVICYNDSTLANTSYQLRTATFQVPSDGNYLFTFENYTGYNPNGNSLLIDSVTIQKLPLPPCTGAPYTGLLAAIDSTLCPGDPAQLQLQGYPTGLDGISRIWQSSPDSGLTWQTISGATGVNYSSVFGAATIAFRVIATCAGSGLSDTSNVAFIHKNALLDCYCKPAYSTSVNNAPPLRMMGSTSLHGEQNTAFVDDYNTCFTCSSGALNYYDKTTLYTPVILYTDSVYSVYYEVPGPGFAAYMFKIWVDLNNDAAFQLSEAVYQDTVYQGYLTRTMHFSIPGGTTAGIHRMRVLMLEETFPQPEMDTVQACGAFQSGETRDYLVEVQSPVVPSNDHPAGATVLSPGAGCGGASNGTTILATVDGGEPLITCSDMSAPVNTVWYRFTAPASGRVRISTANGNGTLPDTKMMVYAVANANDYTTYQPVGCDDDNGGYVLAGRSLLYLASLQAGLQYYIQVSHKDLGTTDGTFCISVDEMTDTMISSEGQCLFGGTGSRYGGNAWVSLVDAQGRLVSNARTNNAYVSILQSPAYINSGPVRSYGSKRFLDRNWSFELAAPLLAPADVQLFFHSNDWTTLAAAAPGSTPANATLTQLVGGNCGNAYQPFGAAPATLLIASWDTSNAIAMVQFQTAQAGPLFISGENTTGIAQTGSVQGIAGLQLYPNPAAEVLHVQLQLSSAATLLATVYDLAGRKLTSMQVALAKGSNAFAVAVAGLSAGMYQLHLENAATREVLVTRFVHQ